MMRFIASSVLTLLGNAAGLIIASLLLNDFHIHPVGFIVSVVFFTGVEILLGPFVLKMALRYLPALRGGIALVTTLVGLLLTSMFTDGLSIDGLSTWIMAPLIIWLSVLLAAILLPMVIFKKTLAAAKQHSEA
jgi:hypothetical protein